MSDGWPRLLHPFIVFYHRLSSSYAFEPPLVRSFVIFQDHSGQGIDYRSAWGGILEVTNSQWQHNSSRLTVEQKLEVRYS